MLRDELIPALEYASYAAGWRHAPRALALVERLGHRIRDRALDVTVHRGHVGGVPVTARIAAWDVALAREISRRIAGEAHREPSRRASEIVPALAAGVDLAFLEVPEFRAEPFVSAGFVTMPKRVAHVETLGSDDPPLVRRVRRAIEARGLSARTTRDRHDLARFVRELYRPFVTERHGVHARATPSLVLQLVLSRGRLLQVVEGDRVVAGALLATGLLDPQRLEIVVIGAHLETGDDEIVRTAPVIFARDLARREGFSRCDHLGSSPFLGDGIFRRKRRYGTVPEDMTHRKDRVMVSIAKTAGARAFLTNEPFLVLDGGALRTVEVPR